MGCENDFMCQASLAQVRLLCVSRLPPPQISTRSSLRKVISISDQALGMVRILLSDARFVGSSRLRLAKGSCRRPGEHFAGGGLRYDVQPINAQISRYLSWITENPAELAT
jgi:hypothetical protein